MKTNEFLHIMSAVLSIEGSFFFRSKNRRIFQIHILDDYVYVVFTSEESGSTKEIFKLKVEAVDHEEMTLDLKRHAGD